MKYVMCVVRDAAADVYGIPMFMGSIGQAIRSFTDECQREAADNQLFKHPEDFELFHVGVYDDAEPEFTPCVPRSLIRGMDCRRS